LLLNEDESVASFRLHGYIREILPVPWVLHAKRNWKQSLAMVCPFCCNTKSYDAKKVHCPDCDKDRVIVFHFILMLEEYLPSQEIRNASPELKLYLSGRHAQELLQISADEYINDISKRKIAHEKLDSLICKAVTISVCRASEPNKNYGYQIINSILAPQPFVEKKMLHVILGLSLYAANFWPLHNLHFHTWDTS